MSWAADMDLKLLKLLKLLGEFCWYIWYACRCLPACALVSPWPILPGQESFRTWRQDSHARHTPKVGQCGLVARCWCRCMPLKKCQAMSSSPSRTMFKSSLVSCSEAALRTQQHLWPSSVRPRQQRQLFAHDWPTAKAREAESSVCSIQILFRFYSLALHIFAHLLHLPTPNTPPSPGLP